VDAGTDTITDLSGSDVLKVSYFATANATVTAAFTATSATSNAGIAILRSAGYTVNLNSAGAANGTNGYSVTNTGAGATFTGSTYNDTLTGGTNNDTLNGGAGNDTLNGGNSIDTLTGSAGADTFNYSSPLDAIISGTTSPSFERITDLAIGTDGLDGPNAVSAANVKQLGDVGSSLTSDSITALLTTTNFLASGASTFTFGSGAGLRTFIALNDATAGYDSTTDGIIEITGYTGTLTSLAII
jgi:Ca2+-binding RTX toxin-like protein